jgi:F0F1-type ATP synthase assembly protein I
LQGFRKEIIASGTALGIALLIYFNLQDSYTTGWIAGYLLGLIAVFGHFSVFLWTKSMNDDEFFINYFIGIAIRFLLVLLLFVLLVAVLKIEQISFTLSFIISYILHSVIEIILINKMITKIPEKDHILNN